MSFIEGAFLHNLGNFTKNFAPPNSCKFFSNLSIKSLLTLLLLNVKVGETNFVLVNICNPNTKTEQVATLYDLDKILENIKYLYDKYIVLTRDSDFFFDTYQL